MAGRLHHLEIKRRIHETYFEEIERFYRFAIPPGTRVLELGCHTGRLLAAVQPSIGLGIDRDAAVVDAAREIHAGRDELTFVAADAETFDWSGHAPFDYIILSDLTPLLTDIQTCLERLHAVCHPSTRLLINFHNNVWHPALRLASRMNLRGRYEEENWLSTQDVQNLLYLSGFEEITRTTRVLLPVGIPLLTPFMNRFLAKMPGIRHLCLTCCLLARPRPETAGHAWQDRYTVSVVVPTRNEAGNIDAIFRRTPRMGRWTELVFVDGHSTDGTVEAIETGMAQYGDQWHDVRLIHQTGRGKGQAVRQAFEDCRGDILMILDSDITMPAEDLPKYYKAISTGRGDFINGSRLVYPMTQQAMRFLNMIANKLFAVLFTWLLEQPVKDTLCGTKVCRREDYIRIAANRVYFGDFDPFGDFDLLFGAAKLNLKIVDMPIRYQDRTYGEIKIDRWRDGILLVKMCWVAFKKLKLS